jgi:hemerythrin-like metal-binding protein
LSHTDRFDINTGFLSQKNDEHPKKNHPSSESPLELIFSRAAKRNMKLEWDENWEGLNDELDSQHKEIIALAHQILNTESGSPQNTSLFQKMLLLGVVCQKHFAQEEAYLLKWDPAQYKEQKSSHLSFLEKWEGFSEYTRTTGVLAPQVKSFLSHWVRSHLGGMDQRAKSTLPGSSKAS